MAGASDSTSKSAAGGNWAGQFGLARDPFSTVHDPSFLLGSRPLRSILEELRRQIAGGSSLIWVRGREGVGKSALVDAIQRDGKNGAPIASVMNPAGSWASIGQEIGAQLGLAGDKLAPSSIGVAPGEERDYRIVIDAAERLGPEALKHFGAFLDYEAPEGKSKHRFGVILISRDPAPEELSNWISERTHTALDFDSLNEDETRRYIERRMKLAGAEDQAIFAESALREIARSSGGLPGAINRICHAALEASAAQGRQTVDGIAETAAGPVASAGKGIDMDDDGLGAPKNRDGFQNPLAETRAKAPQLSPQDLLGDSSDGMSTSISRKETTAAEQSGRRSRILELAAAFIVGVLLGTFGTPLIVPPAEPETRIVRVEVPVEVIVEVPVEVERIVIVEKPAPVVEEAPVEVVEVVPPVAREPEPEIVREVLRFEPAPTKPLPSVLPNAYTVLKRTFARSQGRDHTSRVELVEYSAQGAMNRGSFEMARLKQRGRLLTLGILNVDGSETETRVLSIETGRMEDERFSYRTGATDVQRIKAERRADSFAGSDFSFDDFRYRTADQFLIYGLSVERVDRRDFYTVSTKPRYRDSYGRVDFVVDANDYTLLEVRFFRGTGVRPYRVLQYPRNAMKQVGNQLVPMRLVSRNFTTGLVSEARIVEFEAGRNLDARLFTLNRLQADDLEIPKL